MEWLQCRPIVRFRRSQRGLGLKGEWKKIGNRFNCITAWDKYTVREDICFAECD